MISWDVEGSRKKETSWGSKEKRRSKNLEFSK
jgi:hypothetical protein